MARAAIRLVVVASVVWLSGCGTAMNLVDECVPYGGVIRDATHLAKLVQGDDHGGCGVPRVPVLYQTVWLGVFSCVVLDVPLSLVADTVTLPWTTAISLYRLVPPAAASEPLAPPPPESPGTRSRPRPPTPAAP